LVTPSEAIDAVTTLSLIGLDDRQEAFLSLRSVLTSRVEDFPVFEELFEGFWGSLGQNNQPRKIVECENHSTDARQARLTPRGREGGGLVFFLEPGGAGEWGGTEQINFPAASNVESSAEKDFSLFGTDELEEISRLARRIAKRLER